MRYFLNKFRTFKMKFFVLAIVILSLYLFLSYILLEVWFVKNSTKEATVMSASLTYVVMHIDMKGTPLKLSYLESLLPLLKENGVNSLLMEYEDMFPYEGKLANLSAENCYKKQELTKFLFAAVKSGFEIIPLVQTFGHLEYALKLPEFQHLREEPLYPDSMCPSKLESVAFVKHLLEQIINFHNMIRPLRYIHIGCDEVFHMNECQHCQKRALANTDIFLRHVKTLSDVIKSQYANTAVLVWDDMLRGIKPNKWNNIDEFTNVHPVCWDYEPELQVSHANLYKYHSKFKHMWIASAYKGADGRTATFPDLRKRYQNTYNWMSLISNYKFGGERKVFSFKGIILTGWSRYSHMDPPCEVLPVAIPSLILNLMVIQKMRNGVKEVTNEDQDFVQDFLNNHLNTEMMRSLGCVIDIDNYDNSECNFDSKELYDTLKTYTLALHDIDNLFKNDEFGLRYMEFYSKLNLVNKNTITKNIEMLNSNLQEIRGLENKVTKLMSKYYESDFVAEYINYKTFHIKRSLRRLINIYDINRNVSTWKRRPKNITYFTLT